MKFIHYKNNSLFLENCSAYNLAKNNKSSMSIAGTLTSNNYKGKNNIEFVINDISVNNI